MRLASILLVGSLATTFGCAGLPDRKTGEGCPPGVPCESLPRREPEGVAAAARHDLEPRLDALPLVGVNRSHPRIGRHRGQGSLSIGSATHGFVVDCRTMPAEGPFHAILREHAQRGTACATDDLVEALLAAAAQVGEKRPAARMAIGNLGRAGGGDIPWSVSHRSGRDADIGLYVLGPDGKPFFPSSLVLLDRNGMGEADGVPVRFDTVRNWLLVKALLTNPSISVQWMFLANPLKRMMLRHARKAKESADLLRRADEVLNQPRRSKPHNDHLHLRIGCPPDDVLEGCRDTGTQRSWFRDPSSRIDVRVEELLTLVQHDDPAVRADAVTVLGRIGTPEARQEVLRRLDDREAEVRRAAARSLLDGGVEGIEDALARRLGAETDGTVTALLLGALDRGCDRWKRPRVLAALLAVTRPCVKNLGVFAIRGTVQDWALDAIGRLPVAVAMKLLAAALENGEAPPAKIAARMRQMTGANPDEGAPDSEAAARAWRAWWRDHKDRAPREWWAEAMRRRGLEGEPSMVAVELARQASRMGEEGGRWLVEAVAAGLGIRPAPWSIEPLPVLLMRALAPGGAGEFAVPEPDPAGNGGAGAEAAADVEGASSTTP